MIVVLDSGVWISALEFGETPLVVLEKALAIDQLATCDQIEEEISRVLVNKMGWDRSRVIQRLKLYLRQIIWVSVAEELHGVCRDPDDMVVECAINANAEVIVAGDKDLLALANYQGIRIVSPREYITLRSQ